MVLPYRVKKKKNAGFFKPPNKKALLEFEKKKRNIQLTITNKKIFASNLRETADNLKHYTPKMDASKVIDKCIEISDRLRLLDAIGYQDPWKVSSLVPKRGRLQRSESQGKSKRKESREVEL